MCSVGWYPNGIAFGRDDGVLYVADTFGRRIVAFQLDGARLGGAETAVEMPHGLPDGFAIDGDGTFIVAALADLDYPEARGELQAFDESGKLLDVLPLGDGRMYTNVAVADDGRLIVTHSDGGEVLAVDGWAASPLPLHPFRAVQSG